MTGEMRKFGSVLEINTEIRELNIKRIEATEQELKTVDSQISRLLKLKMELGGHFRRFHLRMHKAAEATNGRKIIGMNDD